MFELLTEKDVAGYAFMVGFGFMFVAGVIGVLSDVLIGLVYIALSYDKEGAPEFIKTNPIRTLYIKVFYLNSKEIADMDGANEYEAGVFWAISLIMFMLIGIGISTILAALAVGVLFHTTLCLILLSTLASLATVRFLSGLIWNHELRITKQEEK